VLAAVRLQCFLHAFGDVAIGAAGGHRIAPNLPALHQPAIGRFNSPAILDLLQRREQFKPLDVT
jgi:hypothetical protein